MKGTARKQSEHHLGNRTGWLRAAVLGANDGIISTASLILGVASAGADHRTILLTGASSLIAGAMSMAAGEFVSVHSQEDTEHADLAREREELKRDPAGEQLELAGIYVERGLEPYLAEQVARDELGLSETTAARPTQAALASAGSFSVGALLPIAVAAIASSGQLIVSTSLSSLIFLAGLGALSARLGGAPLWAGSVRVACWGAIAMAVTAGAGALLGAVAL